MRWADNTWFVLNNPSIGTGLSRLTAVSSPKPGTAWAVGYFANTSRPYQIITELIVC
jgi:hypothetical protein